MDALIVNNFAEFMVRFHEVPTIEAEIKCQQVTGI